MHSIEICVNSLKYDIPALINALSFYSKYMEKMYISAGTGQYSEYTSYDYFDICGESKFTKDELTCLYELHSYPTVNEFNMALKKIKDIKKYSRVIEEVKKWDKRIVI